jgi:hypothetical protein
LPDVKPSKSRITSKAVEAIGKCDDQYRAIRRENRGGTSELFPVFIANSMDFAILGKPGKVLCVQSPSGIEEFFEMSLLAAAGSPDRDKMKELADRYEIEFLLPRPKVSV